MRSSERGCSHGSFLTAFVCWAFLAYLGFAASSIVTPSWVARAAIAVLWWPALLFIIGSGNLLISWIHDAFVRPLRARALLRRIEALDDLEAPEESFEEAFAALQRNRDGLLSSQSLRHICKALFLTEGKSRRYFLFFLAEFQSTPAFRRILEEVAERWDDPISPLARRQLRPKGA